MNDAEGIAEAMKKTSLGIPMTLRVAGQKSNRSMIQKSLGYNCQFIMLCSLWFC